jgi:hypothetical protein
MGFASFMASTPGRLARIVAGLILIAVGIWVVGGLWGIVLAVVGAVPLIAGLFDICIIGALFLDTPLRGEEIRTSSQE